MLILDMCDVPNLRQQKLAVGFFSVIEKNVFPFPVEQAVRRIAELSSGSAVHVHDSMAFTHHPHAGHRLPLLPA